MNPGIDNLLKTGDLEKVYSFLKNTTNSLENNSQYIGKLKLMKKISRELSSRDLPYDFEKIAEVYGCTDLNKSLEYYIKAAVASVEVHKYTHASYCYKKASEKVLLVDVIDRKKAWDLMFLSTQMMNKYSNPWVKSKMYYKFGEFSENLGFYDDAFLSYVHSGNIAIDENNDLKNGCTSYFKAHRVALKNKDLNLSLFYLVETMKCNYKLGNILLIKEDMRRLSKTFNKSDIKEFRKDLTFFKNI